MLLLHLQARRHIQGVTQWVRGRQVLTLGSILSRHRKCSGSRCKCRFWFFVRGGGSCSCWCPSLLLVTHPAGGVSSRHAAMQHSTGWSMRHQGCSFMTPQTSISISSVLFIFILSWKWTNFFRFFCPLCSSSADSSSSVQQSLIAGMWMHRHTQL